MTETNGNGNGRTLEIGKLIGAISSLEKGQDAIFNKLEILQKEIIESGKDTVGFRHDIDDMENDINGIGMKIETVKTECEQIMENYKKEIEQRQSRFTIAIISALAVFMAFLTIWVYILKPDLVSQPATTQTNVEAVTDGKN